jgi:Dynamin family
VTAVERPGPQTPGPPLPQVVRETRERLTAFLATADPDAAAWVERVRAARPDTPTVVVVGETNRGKSSLVNALIATPNLSPVDADVATAHYLVLRHGVDWSARACYPGLRDPVPIPLAELTAWVCAAHDLPDGALPPRYVEVQAPIPLLERLTLVDTPGVGGLDAAHGELAAEAAAGATGLLFVVDAAAPFTRGELGFLQRLADHVETVLFALAKTDLHRGWRQVLDADRALLDRHAPRFAKAEFHPVSARLFDSAATAPTAEVAILLRERSGVAELQTALQRQVSGRTVMLGEANVLRAIATSLAGVIARLESEQRALTGAERGEASADALRQRRDELTAERRFSGRSWQLRLRGEIQRARLEALHDVAGQIRSTQAWFRRAIDDADRATLAQLPYQLDAALKLISVRVTAGLGQRLSRVADAVLAELFPPAELNAVHTEFARRGGGRPPVVLQPPDRRSAGTEDKLLIAMGVSGGLGVGRMAALPLAGLGAAAGLIVLPVTIVLGLGAGWWMARARRHAADKAHLKQWLAEVLADARSALDQVVAEQMIDAEQRLSLALDEALGRRVTAIEDELREVDRALRMDTADRNRELTTVRKSLAEATAGRQRAEQLLARIRELRNQA